MSSFKGNASIARLDPAEERRRKAQGAYFSSGVGIVRLKENFDKI